MSASSRLTHSRCYKITKDGKESYIFGTQHYFYHIPKELNTLFAEKKITKVLTEKVYDEEQLKRAFILDQFIEREAKRNNISTEGLDDSKKVDGLLKKLSASSRYQYLKNSDIRIFFTPNKYRLALSSFLKNDSKIKKYIEQNLEADYFSLDTILEQGSMGDRHNIWKDKILSNLRNGGVLIAVGYAHLFNKKNNVLKILTKEGYKLEHFSTTITFNHKEFDDFIEEKISSETDQKLISSLPSLISAVHQRKLTGLQKKELNRILKVILDDQKHFLLNKYRPLVDEAECQSCSLFEYISKNIEGINDDEMRKILELFTKPSGHKEDAAEMQRKTLFFICIFYPEQAKQLAQNLKNNTEASELFSLYGLDPSPMELKVPDKKIEEGKCIQTNIKWLDSLLESVSKAGHLFIEDIDLKDVIKSLDSIDDGELKKLILLFNKYKNAKLSQESQDYSQWQIYIVLKKVLITLADQHQLANEAIHQHYEELIDQQLSEFENNQFERFDSYKKIYRKLFPEKDEKSPLVKIGYDDVSNNYNKLDKYFNPEEKEKYSGQKNKIIDRIGKTVIEMNSALYTGSGGIQQFQQYEYKYLEKLMLIELHRYDGILNVHDEAWKHYTWNALICITVIGAPIVAIKYLWTGALFYGKTKSQEKIEEVDKYIKNRFIELEEKSKKINSSKGRSFDRI